MKYFKISNLITKTLLSSEKTKKLINGGVLIRGGSSKIILEKKNLGREGGAFIRDLRVASWQHRIVAKYKKISRCKIYKGLKSISKINLYLILS